MSEIKERLGRGEKVFEQEIDRLILSNPNFVFVHLTPDAEMEGRESKAMQAKMAELRASLSEEQLSAIQDQTHALIQHQQAPDSEEAMASIPKLSLQDVEAFPQATPQEVSQWDGDSAIDIAEHAIASNGVLYLDVAFDASVLTVEEYTVYLPLLKALLLESGTSSLSREAFSQKIMATTGGISLSDSRFYRESKSVPNPVRDLLAYFFVSGKCTVEQIDNMLEIVREIQDDTPFLQKRASEYLRSRKAQLESSLLSSGQSFAKSRLSAMHTFSGLLHEKRGGVEHLMAIGDLQRLVEERWEEVEARLHAVRRKLFSRRNMVVGFTGDGELIEAAKAKMDKLILPERQGGETATVRTLHREFDESMLLPRRNELIVAPTQVSFVLKGQQLFPEGSLLQGGVELPSKLVSRDHLWNEVRVKGGAYGSGFSIGTSGIASFFSYRDPHIANTLQTYDASSDFLQAVASMEEAQPEQIASLIEGTVIGCVGDLDQPQSVDQQGYSQLIRYLKGTFYQDRVEYRQGVMGAGMVDIEDLSRRLSNMKEEGISVVVASRDNWEQKKPASADSFYQIEPLNQ